jgi:HD-GYP domain-containing protein (c-di-GMP phosphodiesterase class II)
MRLAGQIECNEDELEALKLAAPLLDVGKIGLPDALLTKTGQLSRSEWELVRQHPVWGEELLRQSKLPRSVQKLVRWHHERLDGTGYPDGLMGEQISLPARILHVADIAAALQDDRPHRPAWASARIEAHLLELSGVKLDDRVVDCYLRLSSSIRSRGGREPSQV